MKPVIVGAGLAGLIAACHFKESQVIEAGPRVEGHRALLRFRGNSVAELTGIPFKQVEVQKEVFLDNKTISGTCPISAANRYSLKVAGAVQARSIGNLAPVTRYIAPDDFYGRLVDKVGGRISWNTPFTAERLADNPGATYVSTAPMSVSMGVAGMAGRGDFRFNKAPIQVVRIKLAAQSDVYQTIYFPEPDLRLFRASITGDVLIIESLIQADAPLRPVDDELDVVLMAFGFSRGDLSPFDQYEVVDQKYGKIVDMPKADREAIMYELTNQHNIFSLGRFATWRNILLDDVVQDLKVIDSLINASEYARHRLMRG